MEALGSLFWPLFLLFTFVLPTWNRWRLEASRLGLIRRIEVKRGSRLITLIHRQEALALFGFPLARYINIEDSEHVLRAIRMTPGEMPIDLLLHTPGGLVLASEQIARALSRRKGKVTVFVPHYAMSGGTMIALASDEIIMDENAVLGPVDPQIGQFPAASVLRVLEQKQRDEIDDQTLILADVAAKAMRQMHAAVTDVLAADKMERERAAEVASILTGGHWTHDYPIDCDELRSLGLPVSHELPEEVYALMELYPQPPQRRPSVQYVPLPYRDPGPGGGTRPRGSR